jgi:hypothetical protein
MSESTENRVAVESEDGATKSFARPTCEPEDLAEFISGMPNQQKAEAFYELVLFAAMAAAETDHPALNEYLAELEDMAVVYTDPKRIDELRETVAEAFGSAQQTGAGEGRQVRP